MSGTVAEIPAGPEGVPPQLWPASVLGEAQLDTIALLRGLRQWDMGQFPGHAPAVVSLRQAWPRRPSGSTGRDPLGAARKASQRPGFPEIAGWDGKTPSTTALN